MSTERFEVEGDHIELNQLLKLVGFCSSGGEGKHLVAAGLVEVDGKVETRMRCKITWRLAMDILMPHFMAAK